MKIENVRPTPVDMAPAEEERKAELPGKKKPHERKLKKKFEKKLKAAKAAGEKAKHTAKRARRTRAGYRSSGERALAETPGEQGQGRYRCAAWQRWIYPTEGKEW